MYPALAPLSLLNRVLPQMSEIAQQLQKSKDMQDTLSAEAQRMNSQLQKRVKELEAQAENPVRSWSPSLTLVLIPDYKLIYISLFCMITQPTCNVV